MANMHLVTGYAGKEHVTSDDQGSFNAAFFGKESFILNSKDKFNYEIISNTEIKIKPGDFYAQGRFIRLQNPVILNFEVGNQTENRTDKIYIKYIKDKITEIEECDLIVINGNDLNKIHDIEQKEKNKNAILEGLNEAYFLLYTVDFNGFNLKNVTLKCVLNNSMEENNKKMFKKLDKAIGLSNKDLNQIFEPNFYSIRSCSNIPKNSSSYGSLIVTKADLTLDDSSTDTIQIYIDKNSNMYIRNCIDQTANWTDWKEYVSTTFTGELNNLQTENKTSLVGAINEVFQFGVDKGNKIVSKLNALFDKDFKNLTQIAEEMNMCKISSILQCYSSIEDDSGQALFFDTKILKNDRIYDIEQNKYIKQYGKFSLENNNDIFYTLDNNDKLSYHNLIDFKNNFYYDNYYKESKKYYDCSYSGLYIKLNGKLKIIQDDEYDTKIFDIYESRKESIKTKGKLIYADDKEIFYYDDKNKKLYIYNHNFQLKKSINEKWFIKDCKFVGNVYVYKEYSYSDEKNIIKIYDNTLSLKRNEVFPKKVTLFFNNIKRLFGLPKQKKMYFCVQYDGDSKTKLEIYKIDENGILTKKNTFDCFTKNGSIYYLGEKFVAVHNYKKDIKIFTISKVLERK